MSEEFYSLVTDFGAAKQLQCIQEGLPFEVYQIALGDGNGKYYEPTTDQTELVNEVWRGLIDKCEWTDDRFYCVTSVPAEVGGFVVREAGVFDKDNNMLVVSKFPETTKQAPDSGTVKQLTIRIELQLSNKELAELVINPNMSVVTKDELDSITEDIEETYQKISEKGQPNGYVLIPLEFIPEISTKSILTPFCLNSCRLDTKGNPDLLSAETVKVLKYTSSISGVFYTALETVLEKDTVVYADSELTEELNTIVAVDTSTKYIAFGEIETLTEYEDNPLHYSASTTGEFYLNLTRICISDDETYTDDGEITTHIYITAHAPFTYTTASSQTHNVEEDLVLDVVDLCPSTATTQNFNLFVNCENDEYSLTALSNQIFTQMLEPEDFSANDVWFKILEPLASYIYLLNIWQETNMVPVGVFSLEGGET